MVISTREVVYDGIKNISTEPLNSGQGGPEMRQALLSLVLMVVILGGCSQGGPAAPDNEPTAGAGVTFAD